MRLGVVLVRVVQVVRGHERQAQVLGQPAQVRHDPALDVEAVVHDLAVVVVLAEDVPELGGGRHGLVVLAQAQAGLDLAGGAAGGGDQPRGVLAEQLAVQARPLRVDRVQRGDRAHPEQVVHAGGVLAQQRHVGVGAAAGDVVPALVGLAPAGLLLVRAVLVSRGDVGLEADDRPDPRGLGLGPEVVGAEQVPVVRDRQRVHAEALGLGEEVVQLRGAVEHRILGVRVEVDEAAVLHGVGAGVGGHGHAGGTFRRGGRRGRTSVLGAPGSRGPRARRRSGPGRGRVRTRRGAGGPGRGPGRPGARRSRRPAPP